MSDDDNDDLEDYNPPADRFLTAQMWWIASELVRRHPHLLISKVQDSDGFQLLLVHDEQDGMRIQFDLVGGVKFLVAGAINRISWIEILAAANPHEIIKRLEVDAGLGVPAVTPGTTPKALAYRVIASCLTSVVNDRHEWYAVRAPMSLEEHPENPECEHFGEFPSTVEAIAGYVSAIAAARASGGSRVFHQPFWAVLRDFQAVAIVDMAGTIHTIAGPVELLPFYESMNRNLTLTAARVLGPFMP